MKITRLDEAIKAAGIPIYGVSGSQGATRVDFLPSATAQQRTDAAAIVAGFDWSDAADAAADLAAAKVSIAAAIDKGVVQDGDKTDRVCAAIVKSLLVELNALRAKVGLADKTANDLFTAIKAEVGK